MRSINVYYENFESLLRFVTENEDCIFDTKQSALLIQVFSGCCEHEYFSRVLAEISQLIPHASIIGATTGGEIMNGVVSRLKIVLSFTLFYHSTVRGALFTSKEQNDFNLGISIASELSSDKAKVLILFADGISINAENLLRGIQTANPYLPVAGGIAGDHCHMKPALVAYNGQMTDSGVVGVVLEGEELTVNHFQHLGWQSIGKDMTITKSAEKRVFTIDNLPAYKVFQKYLGMDKTREFRNAVEYPIMADRCGVQIARVPMTLYDDDSIGFAAELIQGEHVRLSFGNINLIIDNIKDLCRSIKEHYVESIFVYSCSCRKGFLQGLSEYETQPLEAIAPTVGFFTGGEFFHAYNTNHLLNASMTILALSEKQDFPTVESQVGGAICDQPPEVVEIVHHGNVIENDVGSLRALTHLINTVTVELEQAQEKLKYNVIGEMAAALGHELRNPMTTVRGYLQIFQQKEQFFEYRRQIDMMIEELDQANSIITEFLSLSKNKRVEMKCGNINDVLKKLFPLFQADAFQQGHNICLELGIIPEVKFDTQELKQVIINLVHNGLEAMKNKGVITIRTYSYENELVLSIQDTGPGIPPEILDKLGTPFVTTKDRGTGLGLPICYRIADRHGADIEIQTGPKGTMFLVKFKLSD